MPFYFLTHIMKSSGEHNAMCVILRCIIVKVDASFSKELYFFKSVLMYNNFFFLFPTTNILCIVYFFKECFFVLFFQGIQTDTITEGFFRWSYKNFYHRHCRTCSDEYRRNYFHFRLCQKCQENPKQTGSEPENI